eukprot:TRINITY_DN2910_c0_g1_i1.p1 TRINITY_DN2910_c0_g1~~TRINITY_DN2910_c0_g1_i1.p1  ORF type:complete len:805 (+),score=138.20 TRINITY_DN2910_c0_g1_i1:28-2415(+)
MDLPGSLAAVRARRASSANYGEYRYHLSLAKPIVVTAADKDGPPPTLLFDESTQVLAVVKSLEDDRTEISFQRFARNTHPATAVRHISKKKQLNDSQDIENPRFYPLPDPIIIPDRGEIIRFAFSPDYAFLGIQRVSLYLEIFNLKSTSKVAFKLTPRTSSSGENKVLGFHWTSDSNLFVVGSRGVEFYSICIKDQSPAVKLVKEYRMAINWFVFAPAPTRVLLVSHGNRSSELQPYHFTHAPDVMMKLPHFDLHLRHDSTPVKASDVVLSKIYFGVFCIYINSRRNKLILYHISKDRVTPKLSIDLHTSGPVQVSVLDSLIVTHNLDQQVSIMFDIKLHSPQDGDARSISFPIAAPLPLTFSAETPTPAYATENLYADDWKFYLPNVVVSQQDHIAWHLELDLRSIAASFSQRDKLVDFLLRRDDAQQLLLKTLRLALLERESLTVLGRIFDMLNRPLAAHLSQTVGFNGPVESDFTVKKTATFWRTFLRSSTALPRTAPLGSKLNPSLLPPPALSTPPSSGSLATPSLTTTGASDDDEGANGPSSTSVATPSDSESSSENLPVASPLLGSKKRNRNAVTPMPRTEGYLVVSQEMIYAHVLLPVEETGELDSHFLVAVVVEYVRCLNYQSIPVQSFLYEFIIDQLVRHNRFYQLHQFLQYHVIADSLHVACQLLSLETLYPPCYQLALDMLKRLGAPEQIIEVLLSKGQVVQALRYFQKLRQNPPLSPHLASPAQFLEVCKNDPITFYTVYNYFQRNDLIKVRSCSEYIRLYETGYLEEEAPVDDVSDSAELVM